MKKLYAFVMLGLLSGVSHAEGLWYVSISPGAAVVDNDDFKSGSVFQIYGGYQFTPYLGLETGTTLFDKFAAKSDDRIYIQGYGQSFGVTGHVPIKRIVLNGGAGLYGWRMEAQAGNDKIGEDQGVSPYVSVGVDVILPANMSIGGGSYFYSDVSGTDILTFNIHYGFRF